MAKRVDGWQCEHCGRIYDTEKEAADCWRLCMAGHSTASITIEADKPLPDSTPFIRDERDRAAETRGIGNG